MSVNIDISNNNLFNIPDLKSENINNIWLDINNISKIENLPNTLVRLFIRDNKIEKLENLPEGLEELWINNNNISTIENLPSTLKRLYINSNKINSIVSLPENIELVQMMNNSIGRIPDWILDCKKLYIFKVDDDVIIPKNFKTILNARRINTIEENYYENNNMIIPDNKIDIPNEHMNVADDNNDIIDDEEMYNDGDEFFNNNDFVDDDIIDNFQDNRLDIYSDEQNIHDTTIQSSLTRSINNILSSNLYFRNYDLFDAVGNSGLSYTIIRYIMENCNDKTVHEQTNITYDKLFRYVFNYIWNSEHYDELIKILEEEIIEGLDLCFIGRLTRLVNVLSGYHNGVNLTINDKSQIGNIAILLRSKYKGEELKINFIKEMKERGFDNKIINEWIEYIE
jgi:hypothetical protein